MKVKTLVAMVVSSMLAVSFSYAVTPLPNAQLVTDDATSSQTPTNDATTNPGAMDGGNAGNPTATPSDSDTSTSGTSDSSSPGTGGDEESQDQATGDSDY